jgi:Xaa-Pro aminopeptidase
MNQRMITLERRLDHWKIEALLIENPIDLLYLTDLQLSRGRLWVRPGQSKLSVDGRYFGDASNRAPCPVTLWEKNSEKPQAGRIGFDSAWCSVDNLERLKKESPDAEWVGIRSPLMEQRIIKEFWEIERLREAARITWGGMQHVQSLFKEGVSEQELAIEFEYFVRKRGASHLAFESIFAFGENSAYPHHRSSTTRLKKDQIILIDVGAVFEHYCADVTRVFFFGEADSELLKMDRIVRDADRSARQQLRVGAKIGSLDRAARDRLAQDGVESLFTHSLGHGLGLEAHETPIIRWDGDDRDLTIQPQMVMAIEPGLYRPGLGGVRYENSGVVTPGGFESFYPAD